MPDKERPDNRQSVLTDIRREVLKAAQKNTMPARYNPAETEPRIYALWEKAGAFSCGRALPADAEAYCIVIPPPNITGSLHMGHALNNTLQDVMARFERMRGRDVLWQPGLDHAGIATQAVVERDLASAGNMGRVEMGRDAFVARIHAWRDASGGRIVEQLQRLGASCDWSRARFTMDEGFSRAVVKVFVALHKEGLIYKDKRLVNWDPGLKTAVSNLEVEARAQDGHLWHIRYPFADNAEHDSGSGVVVATTRPETMLGDVAVIVHPDDARWREAIGREVRLPFVGRHLPVIADARADPEQGSGAVKITPFHDFNDFAVARRHGLDGVDIFDDEARLNNNVPARFRGLDRFDARRKILAALDEDGLLVKTEAHRHAVPFGDRSGVVIEPRLMNQWFVDAAKLAVPAKAAVEDGRVRFVPGAWGNTYNDWLLRIEPWCISRQIWWGHRVPAWYGPDGHVFVEENEAAALEAARAHYNKETELVRDEDVLDTWFSSALWPFATLGWPDNTPELARYYPTSLLITGFDIIFFWVARMMMMGMHLMGAPPFGEVYIHALVRDEKGEKMTKSRGNVVDPLDVIDTHGADALRFTLCAMAAQGRDIKLSEERIAGGRNFATKLWNAARLCAMHSCHEVAPSPRPLLALNRWIRGARARAARAVAEALDKKRFNDAAQSAHHFVWHIFCDWYLEMAKTHFDSDDVRLRDETRATAAHVLDGALAILHPFMPFITEEIWGVSKDRAEILALSDFPAGDATAEEKAAEAEMDWVMGFVGAVRSVRAEMRVPAGARLTASLQNAGDDVRGWLVAHEVSIMRLARLERIDFCTSPVAGAIEIAVEGMAVFLPLAGVVDMAAETARLKRDMQKAQNAIEGLTRKLGDEAFLSRAPAPVVETERRRLRDALARYEQIKAAHTRAARAH